MSKRDHKWQDREYVLTWFRNKEKEAVKAYRHFVMAGIDEEKR
ncbi:MAG: hypothetical protein V3S49_04750 [Thermodesulfobacteriota bacterium]